MSVRYVEKWVDGEPYARVKNMRQLDTFAKEGGWQSAQAFLDEMRCDFGADIKDKWFTIVHGRIFYLE